MASDRKVDETVGLASREAEVLAWLKAAERELTKSGRIKRRVDLAVYAELVMRVTLAIESLADSNPAYREGRYRGWLSRASRLSSALDRVFAGSPSRERTPR